MSITGFVLAGGKSTRMGTDKAFVSLAGKPLVGRSAGQDVDRLLFYMVDQRRSEAELVGLGFDPAFVDRVYTMMRRSQFKRRPPVIAKVSSRTVNVEFRYARDWGI